MLRISATKATSTPFREFSTCSPIYQELLSPCPDKSGFRCTQLAFPTACGGDEGALHFAFCTLFLHEPKRKCHERYSSRQKTDVSTKGLATGTEGFFLQHVGALLCKTHYILFKPLKDLWERMLPPLKYVTTRWVLLPKLKSDSAEMRSYAAQALESMGDAQAVLPLITALQDTDSTVRRFAISSLGHCGMCERLSR